MRGVVLNWWEDRGIINEGKVLVLIGRKKKSEWG